MKSQLGFGNKLLLKVISTMVLVFAITMFFVIKYSYETSQNEAKKYLEAAATNEASIVKGEIEKTILISKLMAKKFESSLKTGVPLDKREVLQKFKDILNNNDLVIGIWFKVKPKNLLFPVNMEMAGKEGYDKVGQFNPYVTKTEEGINVAPGAVYSEKDEWVKGPKETGKTFITKSYLYPVNGKKIMMITVGVPMYKDGKFIGSAGVDISLDAIAKKSQKTKFYNTGYFFLIDSYHTVIAHPIKKFIGAPASKGGEKVINAVKLSQENKDINFISISPNTKQHTFFYSKPVSLENGDIYWDLLLSVPEVEYLTNANFIRNFSIIATLIGLILMSTVVIFTTKKLNFNLRTISEGLDEFFAYLNKEKNETKSIELKSNDEFGAMAKSINENITKTEEGINHDNQLLENVKDVVNHVGEGYLDKRIEKDTSTDSLNELKNLLNTMLENLEKLVGKDLNKISETLSFYMKRDFTARLDNEHSGKIGKEIIQMNRMITDMLKDNQKDGLSLQESSNELTSNVKTLSSNATSQAASLEETAASIDEITSTIQHTSEKAQEMLDISTQTNNSANEGKNLANDTVKAMDEINETVININEAISVIDQIAFQTNILSLNAAVEAATAGEAGKGFAVVAQEVRNLASRSAEAAKEIKELVESATTRANNGKIISTKMIEGFNSLEEKISLTNELIDDVSNAAKEQTAGITQIANAMGQLDKFTQENAIIADKTNTIAKETNLIANDVVANVAKNKFDGIKNSKTNNKREPSKPQSTQKKVPSNESKPITSNNTQNQTITAQNNDEDQWESF